MKKKNTGENGAAGVWHAHVTAVDFIIIASIVIAAFLTYNFIFGGADFDESGVPIIYVVKASGVRDELSDRVSVGDSIYSSESGEYMGKVTAYERRDAIIAATGATIQGQSDIYVTIEADTDGGSESTESGVMTGGVTLKSGCVISVEGKLSLRTASFSFDGVCISIDK